MNQIFSRFDTITIYIVEFTIHFSTTHNCINLTVIWKSFNTVYTFNKTIVSDKASRQ